MKRDARILYNVLASTRRECCRAKLVNSTSRPSLNVCGCVGNDSVVVEGSRTLEVEASPGTGSRSSNESDLSTAIANLAT